MKLVPLNRAFARRCCVTVVAVFVLALSVGATGHANAADTVHYGSQIGAQYSLRLLLEQNQDKHGLQYDFRDFRSGTENILALEQGEVDISTATSQHLLRTIEEDIPIVWILGWGGGYNTLIARNDLPVDAGDYDGLKALALDWAEEGRKLKIGVPTGSMQHLLMLTALEDAGLDPEDDVELVNIPFPVHPRAIESQEVDMVVGLAFFGALSMTSGHGKLFDHLFGEKWGKQEIGFFVHERLVEENPDLVQRIVDSHVEAIEQLGDDDRRYRLEVEGSDLPPPVLEITEKQFLDVDYRTNLSDIARMARRMRAAGWTTEDLSKNIEDKVDFRFLERSTGQDRAKLTEW